MSSGALTPGAAVESIYHDGLHHLHEPTQLAFLKNMMGGLLVGLSALTSFVVAGGCPGLKESNPGIVHFIEGALFSTALITIYFTGGELFTGYPMWLSIAALQRKARFGQYVTAVVTSLSGNLAGSLIAATLFSYVTGVVNDDPQRSFVIEQVETTIVDSPWHVVFVKAIACGYLVTYSMLLGTQNMDGISKALALWLPFTLATSCNFPHTVEYMHIAPLGMMLGARLSVGGFIWKCMLPVILGNTAGGAIFTGAYHWWVFLQCKNGEEKLGTTFREAATEFMDEDD